VWGVLVGYLVLFLVWGAFADCRSQGRNCGAIEPHGDLVLRPVNLEGSKFIIEAWEYCLQMKMGFADFTNLVTCDSIE
jgi:hypothetical protein